MRLGLAAGPAVGRAHLGQLLRRGRVRHVVEEEVFVPGHHQVAVEHGRLVEVSPAEQRRGDQALLPLRLLQVRRRRRLRRVLDRSGGLLEGGHSAGFRCPPRPSCRRARAAPAAPAVPVVPPRPAAPAAPAVPVVPPRPFVPAADPPVAPVPPAPPVAPPPVVPDTPPLPVAPPVSPAPPLPPPLLMMTPLPAVDPPVVPRRSARRASRARPGARTASRRSADVPACAGVAGSAAAGAASRIRSRTRAEHGSQGRRRADTHQSQGQARSSSLFMGTSWVGGPSRQIGAQCTRASKNGSHVPPQFPPAPAGACAAGRLVRREPFLAVMGTGARCKIEKPANSRGPRLASRIGSPCSPP